MKQVPVHLTVEGVQLRLIALKRDGSKLPLVCLHGFGSTKEDYADIALLPRFNDRPLVAYDAPGCGQSECSDLSAISISFLRRTAEAVINHFGFQPFHMVGHSMGGLTALTLAEANPDAILSFTSIEGNLAPEDCFLCRQIIEHPEADEERFLDQLIERIRNMPNISSALYAAALREKVRAKAVKSIFRSMVDLSDNGHLIEILLNLPIPRMFVYGDENRSLSYLGRLNECGIRLAEIPDCGHFPMYANPPALWGAIDDFIQDVEKAKTNG
jgi:pimeloyl-ACP methyl ester carboxylesterase